MREATPLLGVAAAALVALGACASAGSGSNPGAAPATVSTRTVNPSDCVPATIDSAFAAVGPVYRTCNVDRPALAIDTTFVTRGLASPAQSCLSAVVDFVIGTNGLPLPEPIKVVKTNSLDFARVLTQSIVRWRYQPAVRDGHPVRELVQLQAAAQVGPTYGPPPNPSSFANIGPTTC